MRDWSDVLPRHYHLAQTRWERDRAVLRAHEAGVTVRVIATHLNVGAERVRQRLKRARATPTAPVQAYFRQPPLSTAGAFEAGMLDRAT